MGFLGIGTWEILFILILALVVLGPNKLPQAARTIGKTIRAIKKASADLTTVVTREIEASDNEAKSAGQADNTKVNPTPAATDNTAAKSGDDQPSKPGGPPQ